MNDTILLAEVINEIFHELHSKIASHPLEFLARLSLKHGYNLLDSSSNFAFCPQKLSNWETAARLNNVIEQPFNNYFSFCHYLLLFGFVDDIIKGQQYEFNFILFYLCLSLFGYLLSPISYLLSPYLVISGSYPIGGYLDHNLLVDKSWLV